MDQMDSNGFKWNIFTSKQLNNWKLKGSLKNDGAYKIFLSQLFA